MVRKLFPLAPLVLVVLVASCGQKKKPFEDVSDMPPLPPAASSARGVRPVPVEAFADSGAALASGGSEMQQARELEGRGQHWMARMVLEQKALGDQGTPDEIRMLSSICEAQGDDDCLEACAKKLGKPFKRKPASAKDAGKTIAPSPDEPEDSEFGRARAFMLAGKNQKARAILEPMVLEDRATREQTRLLLEICKFQKDKMCIALCMSRLGP